MTPSSPSAIATVRATCPPREALQSLSAVLRLKPTLLAVPRSSSGPRRGVSLGAHSLGLPPGCLALAVSLE